MSEIEGRNCGDSIVVEWLRPGPDGKIPQAAQDRLGRELRAILPIARRAVNDCIEAAEASRPTRATLDKQITI